MKGTWAVLVFALTWPTLATLIYFVALATPSDQAGSPNPWLQAFYSGSKIVQFLLPVLWLSVWQRQKLQLGWPNGNGLALGLGFGLLVGAAILGLYFGLLRGSALLARTPTELRAKVKDFGMATPAGFVVLAAFLSVIHSLLEEYYWRWFVFGQLQRLTSLAVAIIVSGLGFMGHHVVVLAVYFPGYFWAATLPFSLGVASGGMVWAWLYHRTASLGPPWISHLVIDAAIMVVGYDMLFA